MGTFGHFSAYSGRVFWPTSKYTSMISLISLVELDASAMAKIGRRYLCRMIDLGHAALVFRLGPDQKF